MGKVIHVQVEHCGMCARHARQCRALQKYITKEHPETDMVCQVGRRGSFEVVVNGLLVHSKLQTHSFPSHDEILLNVKNVREGLPANYMRSESFCSLM